MIDLGDFLREAAAIVARHHRGRPGDYRRHAVDEPGGELNAYGCADAANLLYTLGSFPPSAEHAAWIATLQSLQEPKTGLCREPSHDPLHTTAHVAGALELFGARLCRPLSALGDWRDHGALASFLDGLDWSSNPWGESHKGAGLYAALVLAGDADATWEDAYFGWLWEEADPDTGFWRRGHVAAGGDALLFHHLAGSFHYLFNHEHARRPLRHPGRMIDSCLRIRRESLFPPLAKTVGFAELDWVYCLNRARRQAGHRDAEARAALADFAAEYAAYLFALDPRTDAG